MAKRRLVGTPDDVVLEAFVVGSADDAECFEVQDWIRAYGEIAREELRRVRRRLGI